MQLRYHQRAQFTHWIFKLRANKKTLQCSIYFSIYCIYIFLSFHTLQLIVLVWSFHSFGNVLGWDAPQGGGGRCATSGRCKVWSSPREWDPRARGRRWWRRWRRWRRLRLFFFCIEANGPRPSCYRLQASVILSLINRFCSTSTFLSSLIWPRLIFRPSLHVCSTILFFPRMQSNLTHIFLHCLLCAAQYRTISFQYFINGWVKSLISHIYSYIAVYS